VPLYEYACRKCGATIEKIQKFSDKPLQKCESCGGQLERLLSSPAIQFKGSGWYITDYARKSSPAADGNESGAKAESKPEASTPSGPVAAKPAPPAK
jgi:putative FmdB family regulatory protein